MANFCMPSLGADMESGILVQWKIAVGQKVARGDVVAVVETDKGAIDVECFQPGVVEELLVAEGTSVPVGTPLARLQDAEEASAVAAPVTAPLVAAPVVAATTPTPPAAQPSPDAVLGERARLSPRARRRAEELGVDPQRVRGTGPNATITTEDIEAAAASPTPTPGATSQKIIAGAMARSKREIPHYYLAHSIDVEAMLTALEARNATKPPAERALAIAPLLRAVALALRDHRELCGWWRDGEFVPAPGIHIGLAISLRDGGLVNPAIFDADEGDLVTLMTKIRDVTERARSGGLRASELASAAITVTSLGDQGVDAVWGVIHPPQVAIVGLGRTRWRPWVVEDRVVPRRVVDVTLAADHRTSNGHRGARFLRRIEQLIKDGES